MCVVLPAARCWNALLQALLQTLLYTHWELALCVCAPRNVAISLTTHAVGGWVDTCLSLVVKAVFVQARSIGLIVFPKGRTWRELCPTSKLKAPGWYGHSVTELDLELALKLDTIEVDYSPRWLQEHEAKLVNRTSTWQNISTALSVTASADAVDRLMHRMSLPWKSEADHMHRCQHLCAKLGRSLSELGMARLCQKVQTLKHHPEGGDLSCDIFFRWTAYYLLFNLINTTFSLLF